MKSTSRKSKNVRVENSVQAFKEKILIVEEQDRDRDLLVSALEEDFELMYAESGRSGLELLSDYFRKISLILVDISLPAKTGFEFLEHVSKNPVLSSIPIMAIVEQDKLDEGMKCLELGAMDVLTKPFHAGLAKNRVRSVIQMKLSQENQYLVEHDDLTGLFTMPAYCQRVAGVLKESGETAYGICALDLKNFKQINQILGERKGDTLLMAIGQELTAMLPGGLIGRDGDQFFVLTEDENMLTQEGFIGFCEQIKNVCMIVNLKMNCGIYKAIDKDVPVAELCSRALAAANSGRRDAEHAYVEYDEKIQDKILEEERIEMAFEAALRNDEFVVWYQPKVEPGTERIVAAEALIRWVPQNGKVIMPGQFIPVLERNGMIGELDRYVFQKVCDFQKKRIMEGKFVIPISANLSGTSFYQTETVETYLQMITDAGIPKNLVPIELSVPFMMDGEDLKALAAEFHQFGFSLHLDDFTMGFPSFSDLASLSLDVLKLDKSLVDFIGTHKGNALIRHMIEYAQETGMGVVAEGVESQEQIEFLASIGCDQIQGYYFATPKDEEMFELILDSME